MQLSLRLSEDNRPGILLNIANQFILARNLDQSISVHQQIRLQSGRTAQRRLMNETNGYLFDCYLDKIRGKG